MKTLTSEQYAPITSAIGFLELPLAEAATALTEWNRKLSPWVTAKSMSEPFPAMLRSLEPLIGGARPRQLLVSVGARWTAYFDCLLRGTDAVSAIGHLTRTVRCQGVAVRCTPHTKGVEGVRHARYGSVQFELFGPLRTEFINYVRTVYVAFNGSRWEFGANGVEQAFEEPERYRARRVRDRFTSDMLERYCQALGIDMFNVYAYGPDAVLIESGEPVPSHLTVKSLAEVQQWLGIVPGEAEGVPG